MNIVYEAAGWTVRIYLALVLLIIAVVALPFAALEMIISPRQRGYWE